MARTLTTDSWRENVPAALYAEADAFLGFLRLIPVMKPVCCPWCAAKNFILRDPRLYECRNCKKRFTPWTGTPFANCRHQDSWAAYAVLRLAGLLPGQAGETAGLSHGAQAYREDVLEKLITRRWPLLSDCWRGFVGNQKPVPLRTTPFSSKEEAEAHHNHEYVQCLECGKLFSSVGTHARLAHNMTALEYREKWQIMKKIPISGFAKRRQHSEFIRQKIASGEVDPMALAQAMHEANVLNGRKKPFGTKYIAEMHTRRLQSQRLWEQSPAIKIVSESIRLSAVARMQARKKTGEKVRDIALELGVACQTLYSWLHKYG